MLVIYTRYLLVTTHFVQELFSAIKMVPYKKKKYTYGHIRFATPSTPDQWNISEQINGIFRNSVPYSSEHVLAVLNKSKCSAPAN